MVSVGISIDQSIIESRPLQIPPLEEVAQMLNEKLKKYFQVVEVSAIDCPDLTEPPFCLTCKGLCGSPIIMEVGGVAYLLPKPQKEKIYDIKEIIRIMNMDPCYVLGAGAGPWPFVGTNCELVINAEINGDKINNKSKIYKVDVETGGIVKEDLPDTELRFGLLSNIYCSLGEEGKVLKIICSNRIGEIDFVASVRKCLEEHYTDKYIGMGGVFLINKGKVRQHIMPDFSLSQITNEMELNSWLKYYEMDTPLIAVGTLVNRDPGLDLRLQHFHSFSDHEDGGHYHIDTTPEDVEYIAYFSLGERVYRIDRPKEMHVFGKT